MLSYQMLVVSGQIQTLGKGWNQQSTAQIKVDGLTQFLTIPLELSLNHQVGDVVQAIISIDKVSYLSS